MSRKYCEPGYFWKVWGTAMVVSAAVGFAINPATGVLAGLVTTWLFMDWKWFLGTAIIAALCVGTYYGLPTSPRYEWHGGNPQDAFLRPEATPLPVRRERTR
jgi:hypothetical protein